MAEIALGLGASVVAFIGVAGQVLQGCEYISGFVDNAREAHDDIQHFQIEIKGFKAAVLSFQTLLRQFEHSSNIDVAAEQIKLALDSSSLAINELKKLIEKYDHDGRKDWWKDIRVAKKKSKFIKCIDRLGRAKADIALAQSTANLILNFDHRSETKVLSSQVIALTSHTVSIIQSATSTREMIADSKKSILDVKTDLATINTDLNKSLEAWPLGVRPMVRGVLDDALQEFSISFRESRGAQQAETSSISRKETLTLADPHTALQNPIIATARKILKQDCCQRTFWFWFASVTIRTVTTTCREASVYQDRSDGEITTSRIVVDIRPHPWALRRGLLIFLERSHLGNSSLNSDIRLRVYNLVPADAPIVKACEEGDFVTTYKLFTTGKASPYDFYRYQSSNSLDISLMDIAWRQWTHHIRVITNANPTVDIYPRIQKLGNVFRLLELLVDWGLDIGSNSTSLMPRLWNVFTLARLNHPKVLPFLKDTTRFIITRALEDPLEFKALDHQEIMVVPFELVPELGACFLCQDTWPVPEVPNWSAHETVQYTMTYLSSLDIPLCGTLSRTLFLDPKGVYLRRVLRHTTADVRNLYMEGFYTLALKKLLDSLTSDDRLFELAIKSHLVLFLELGMHPRSQESEFSNTSLSPIQDFILAGNAELMRSALIEVGKMPAEASEMIEEEACMLIVEELDELRPPRQLSFEKRVYRHRKYRFDINLDKRKRCCKYYLELAQDENYRKVFPEDILEMEGIFKQHALSRSYSSEPFCPFDDIFLDQLEPKAPAINGLTEDFWN